MRLEFIISLTNILKSRAYKYSAALVNYQLYFVLNKRPLETKGRGRQCNSCVKAETPFGKIPEGCHKKGQRLGSHRNNLNKSQPLLASPPKFSTDPQVSCIL